MKIYRNDRLVHKIQQILANTTNIAEYRSFLCSGDSGIGGFKIISQGKLGYLFSELVIYFVLTLIYLFVFFLRTRNKKDSNS